MAVKKLIEEKTYYYGADLQHMTDYIRDTMDYLDRQDDNVFVAPEVNRITREIYDSCSKLESVIDEINRLVNED